MGTQARTLPVQEVISSYKACERANGQKLLVFGLLGTLIEYSAFKKLENLLPSVRQHLLPHEPSKLSLPNLLSNPFSLRRMSLHIDPRRRCSFHS